MAEQIKGINVVIGAETSKFDNSIKGLNKELRETNKNLNSTKKLLRVDPKNVKALTKAQKNLKQGIELANKKLKMQNDELEEARKNLKLGKISQQEFNKIERSIEKTETDIVKMNKQLKTTNKRIKDLNGASLRKLGKQFTNVGKKMTMGLTAPLVALGAVAVKSAANLEGVQIKFKTVFDKTEKEMRDFLKEFRKLAPVTEAESMKMASSIQDMLVPMGFAREEATDFTKDIVHLSGALASFNDTNPADVTNAFGSALAGSYETLRQFGIQTSKTELEQRILAKGLVATKDEITDQMIAAELIEKAYESSEDALNAWSEENLSANENMKLLKRDIEELATQIGTVLLPIVLDIVEKVSEWVEKFNNLDEGTKTTIVNVGLLAAAIGPLSMAIGALSTVIGLVNGGLAVLLGLVGVILTPIGLLVGAVAGLAAIFVFFKDEAVAAMQIVVDFFKDSIQPVIDGLKWIGDRAKDAGDWFGETFSFGEAQQTRGYDAGSVNPMYTTINVNGATTPQTTANTINRELGRLAR